MNAATRWETAAAGAMHWLNPEEHCRSTSPGKFAIGEIMLPPVLYKPLAADAKELNGLTASDKADPPADTKAQNGLKTSDSASLPEDMMTFPTRLM